ncbi:SDR family NAD(P)-dependent oxidoreductase, partial [Hyphomonas atlantica]
MPDLKNKRALVTAAGQGIGRACVEHFAAAGAEVVACDINGETLAKLDVIDGITALKIDLTDADAITEVVAGLGVLDVLFNCAGFV